ncbi:hypothetical protein AVEN_135101-1, partial [Araneus ventricosus]
CYCFVQLRIILLKCLLKCLNTYASGRHSTGFCLITCYRWSCDAKDITSYPFRQVYVIPRSKRTAGIATALREKQTRGEDIANAVQKNAYEDNGIDIKIEINEIVSITAEGGARG